MVAPIEVPRIVACAEGEPPMVSQELYGRVFQVNPTGKVSQVIAPVEAYVDTAVSWCAKL
jgi:hypothetical protein